MKDEETGIGTVVGMTRRSRFKKGIFQYTQFNVIAVSNGIIDIGSFNLLLFLWPTEQWWLLLLFNSVAYSLAVLNSYIWNVRFTFRNNAGKGFREKARFGLQALVSLIISNLAFLVAEQLFLWLRLPLWLVNNLAKGSAMFLSATASFVFMKWFVFQKKEPDSID